MTAYRLSIDLGTSHTVAVVRRDGQPVRALVFDGSPLLPSGVYAAPDGALHTGRDAQRLSQVDPAGYEPAPKRRVDEGRVLLGDREVEVADLLGTVLRRVAAEARLAGVGTAGAVLTCPADWGGPRREVLRRAAARAELVDPVLVDEPVAAAAYCAEVVGQATPPGAALAVFDFGAGTLDVTVVRRDPGGFRVLATGGLDDLGGLDVDAALAGHLGHVIEMRDPELWSRLSAPADPGQARERAAFLAEVRAAKEMLSRSATAPVQVPGRADALHVTRDELERVAGSLVARAVDETRRVIERAGPVRLAGILLVGGSSRIPLVASRLHARFRVAPTMPEQPELPVAHGGLLVAPPPPFVPAPPLPSPGPPAPPVRPTPQVAAKRRRGLRVVLTSVAVVIALLVTTATFGGRWLYEKLQGIAQGNLGSGASNLPELNGELKLVNDFGAAGGGGIGATAAGGIVYTASSSEESAVVRALDAGNAAAKWSVTIPFAAAKMRLTVVGSVLVVDGEDSTTGDDARAALDAASGAVLWHKTWPDRTDVAYEGTEALVEDRTDPPALRRIDLRTGRQKWAVSGPDDLVMPDERMARMDTAWTVDARGGPPAPAEGGFRSPLNTRSTAVLLSESDDGRGTVVDTRTGKVTRRGALPLDSTRWTVFGGLVIGWERGSRPAIDAYRVSDLKRAWRLAFPPGTAPAALKPCARDLVCLSMSPSGSADDVLVAVDLAKGTERWERTVTDKIDIGWQPVGDRLLFGEDSFGVVDEMLLLDAANKELANYGEAGAVGTDGDRVVLRTVTSTGGTAAWAVAVADLAGNRRTASARVGAGAPEQVTLSGDTLVVVTDDKHIKLYSVRFG